MMHAMYVARRVAWLAVLVTIGQAATAETTRVSISSTGAQANNDSGRSSISANGRYVGFESDASNLVAGDTNGTTDVFVRDRQTGTTSLVSVATGGGAGNGGSGSPSISADGRYVAFESDASNLVAGDTNGTQDVFVRDLQTGGTSLVSVAVGGGPGNAYSLTPSISADGRYVAFESDASNLVAGDTNGTSDIFVRDRQTGSTALVSVAASGGVANGSSDIPSISADGRHVVFRSPASNLVTGDVNGTHDVFVRDLQTGITMLVSIATGGGAANDNSVPSLNSISADGRYVTFDSEATNLVVGDTNGHLDVFVHDRLTGTTSLVSASTTGGVGDDDSGSPSISADGRYVAFRSSASNLVAGVNAYGDIFVRDRQTGSTGLVSVAVDGGAANNFSYGPSISADGRHVVFGSNASNLVTGDTNAMGDIFVAERGGAGPLLSSFTVSRTEVAGCKSVTGRVTLADLAPVGGAVVSIRDTLSAATTPATVKIPEGATSKSFIIKTIPVAARENGSVTVSLAGESRSQSLTVRPVGLLSVTLQPVTVVGSQPVAGTAKLECKAGPGPITVDLSSNNPSAANPIATSIVVPQSVQSEAFTVATNAVPSKAYATIIGEANGTTKTKKLTVNVAATVSPTSLRFGNVTVGTTSGVLSTTLSNRGALPYSILGISLSGTNARYYAQTNNCPATLAAGASCTIGVTFAPTVTGSKPATLRIATSATSTPLSVALSGTGVLPP